MQGKEREQPDAGQSQTKETDFRVEMSDNRVMELTLDRSTVEKLLDHAASAARLVGHIEEGVPNAVVGPLADHIDAMVHDLSELLGAAHLIVFDAPTPH